MRDLEQTGPRTWNNRMVAEIKSNENGPIFCKEDGWLYIIGYMTHLNDARWNWDCSTRGLFPSEVDKEFLHLLKQSIKPRGPIEELVVPVGMISVAVHVRKGGGFDKPLLTEQSIITKAINHENYVDVCFPYNFHPINIILTRFVGFPICLITRHSMYIFLLTILILSA